MNLSEGGEFPSSPDGGVVSTQQIHYFKAHKNVLESGDLKPNMVVAFFATAKNK
jgi:hypothetical protein